MLHILYLSHSGSIIGGAEQQLYYLVTNLDRDRCQPSVICPEDGVFANQLRDANIPTTVVPLPEWRKTKSIPFRYAAATRLIDFVKQHAVHIVHAPDSWLSPYGWRVKKCLRVPAISHVRNLIDHKRVRKYRFDRMDRLIAISEQMKAPLVQSGISPEKIDVIVNCVDLSVFKSMGVQRNILCEEFPLGRFVIGMVGRIEPFKRQKEFILAASHVVKECQDVSFLIIGEAHPIAEHLAYEREVRQLVSELKLTAYVTFTGHRTDMSAVMQGLDLLVTASAGSVIAEAMAAGKPVIGTPIGSTTDMIDDGTTGWVVPLSPIEGMSTKIMWLAQNPSLCTQMGRAGRTRAERHFSIAEHVQQVQAIYDQLA